MIDTFQDLFMVGMKRSLPPLLYTKDGLIIDVGASGKYVVGGAIPLGLPDWMWPRDDLPFDDEKVDVIHAYHFLEHLTGEQAIAFLREIERVLAPGGVFQFSVPYFDTSLQAQDLTHKSSWCEDTFRNTFNNDTYSIDGKGPWRLEVHFLVIAGIVRRNLALLGQIIKTKEETM